MAERKCSNCKHYKWHTWDGYEYCMDYEMDVDASECERYEYEEYEEDDEYRPSSTNGDYSPSNPWDAPGMSISDFIGGVSMF